MARPTELAKTRFDYADRLATTAARFLGKDGLLSAGEMQIGTTTTLQQ